MIKIKINENKKRLTEAPYVSKVPPISIEGLIDQPITPEIAAQLEALILQGPYRDATSIGLAYKQLNKLVPNLGTHVEERIGDMEYELGEFFYKLVVDIKNKSGGNQ